MFYHEHYVTLTPLIYNGDFALSSQNCLILYLTELQNNVLDVMFPKITLYRNLQKTYFRQIHHICDFARTMTLYVHEIIGWLGIWRDNYNKYVNIFTCASRAHTYTHAHTPNVNPWTQYNHRNYDITYVMLVTKRWAHLSSV